MDPVPARPAGRGAHAEAEIDRISLAHRRGGSGTGPVPGKEPAAIALAVASSLVASFATVDAGQVHR